MIKSRELVTEERMTVLVNDQRGQTSLGSAKAAVFVRLSLDVWSTGPSLAESENTAIDRTLALFNPLRSRLQISLFQLENIGGLLEWQRSTLPLHSFLLDSLSFWMKVSSASSSGQLFRTSALTTYLWFCERWTSSQHTTHPNVTTIQPSQEQHVRGYKAWTCGLKTENKIDYFLF